MPPITPTSIRRLNIKFMHQRDGASCSVNQLHCSSDYVTLRDEPNFRLINGYWIEFNTLHDTGDATNIIQVNTFIIDTHISNSAYQQSIHETKTTYSWRNAPLHYEYTASASTPTCHTQSHPLPQCCQRHSTNYGFKEGNDSIAELDATMSWEKWWCSSPSVFLIVCCLSICSTTWMKLKPKLTDL